MANATTTELEAVNIMLSSIGEAPVNSLSSGLVDAELAQTTLHNVSREVQAQVEFQYRIQQVIRFGWRRRVVAW